MCKLKSCIPAIAIKKFEMENVKELTYWIRTRNKGSFMSFLLLRVNQLCLDNSCVNQLGNSVVVMETRIDHTHTQTHTH